MPVVDIDSCVAFPDVEAFRAVAVRALQLLDHPESELSIVLTDNDGIRPINATWRAKDAATDVLSFPQHVHVPNEPCVLGDIIISVETAQQQAGLAGHSLFHECIILLVHGLLHLFGHDHHVTGEASDMRAAESRLLAELGVIDRDGLIARASLP